MYVCMYVYTYICIYINIHIYMCIRIYLYTHTRLHIFVYTPLYIYFYIHSYACDFLSYFLCWSLMQCICSCVALRCIVLQCNAVFHSVFQWLYLFTCVKYRIYLDEIYATYTLWDCDFHIDLFFLLHSNVLICTYE